MRRCNLPDDAIVTATYRFDGEVVQTATVGMPMEPGIDSIPPEKAGVDLPFLYRLALDADVEAALATSTIAPTVTLVSAPAGMELHERTLTWSPTTNDLGLHPVEISLEHALGLYTQAFILEVVAGTEVASATLPPAGGQMQINGTGTAWDGTVVTIEPSAAGSTGGGSGAGPCVPCMAAAGITQAFVDQIFAEADALFPDCRSCADDFVAQMFRDEFGYDGLLVRSSEIPVPEDTTFSVVLYDGVLAQATSDLTTSAPFIKVLPELDGIQARLSVPRPTTTNLNLPSGVEQMRLLNTYHPKDGGDEHTPTAEPSPSIKVGTLAEVSPSPAAFINYVASRTGTAISMSDTPVQIADNPQVTVVRLLTDEELADFAGLENLAAKNRSIGDAYAVSNSATARLNNCTTSAGSRNRMVDKKVFIFIQDLYKDVAFVVSFDKSNDTATHYASHMSLPRSLIDKPYLDFVLSHEIFHLFQHAIRPPTARRGTGGQFWWIEATANVAAFNTKPTQGNTFFHDNTRINTFVIKTPFGWHPEAYPERRYRYHQSAFINAVLQRTGTDVCRLVEQAWDAQSSVLFALAGTYNIQGERLVELLTEYQAAYAFRDTSVVPGLLGEPIDVAAVFAEGSNKAEVYREQTFIPAPMPLASGTIEGQAVAVTSKVAQRAYIPVVELQPLTLNPPLDLAARLLTPEKFGVTVRGYVPAKDSPGGSAEISGLIFHGSDPEIVAVDSPTAHFFMLNGQVSQPLKYEDAGSEPVEYPVAQGDVTLFPLLRITGEIRDSLGNPAFARVIYDSPLYQSSVTTRLDGKFDTTMLAEEEAIPYRIECLLNSNIAIHQYNPSNDDDLAVYEIPEPVELPFQCSDPNITPVEIYAPHFVTGGYPGPVSISPPVPISPVATTNTVWTDKNAACDSGILPFIRDGLLQNFPQAEITGELVTFTGGGGGEAYRCAIHFFEPVLGQSFDNAYDILPICKQSYEEAAGVTPGFRVAAGLFRYEDGAPGCARCPAGKTRAGQDDGDPTDDVCF